MQAPFIKIRCHRLELSGTPKRQTQGPGCIAELPVGPGSLPRGASEAPFHLRHVCWGTVGLGCSGGLFLVHQDHTHTHTHTPQPTGGSLHKSRTQWRTPSTTTCVQPQGHSAQSNKQSTCLRELEEELEGKVRATWNPRATAR